MDGLLLVCRSGHDYKPRVANLLNGNTCRRCLIQQRAVPVIILPLGTRARSGSYATARIYDSIEDCAKALKANPNNVRTVAKGRGNSCNGFGVAQITPEQAKGFRENKDELKSFCRAKWPSPKTYGPSRRGTEAFEQARSIFRRTRISVQVSSRKSAGSKQICNLLRSADRKSLQGSRDSGRKSK